VDADYVYLSHGTFAASACMIAIRRRDDRLVILQALIDETEDED